MSNSSPASQQVKVNEDTLLCVLGEMLGKEVIRATYESKWLQGGTVGDVRLISGLAETTEGSEIPYKLVLKTQKKWERKGDQNSWRREYDLYISGLDEVFTDDLRWPICYHAELGEEKIVLWMEFVEGVSGLKMTVDMYERVAEKIGRLQGRLYAQKPSVLDKLSNVNDVSFTKRYYLHYRSWNEVYDYIRSDNCEIPKHICQMLVDIDENSDAIWKRIEKLPVVFCHRDFWVENIFCSEDKIALIDWDTTGWGYMGEDIASLIADESDLDHMLEYYQRCIPAYYKGFSEYADVEPYQQDNCIWELIILTFGYRLVEWFKYAKTKEEKQLNLDTLQKIYEMGQ